MFGFKTLQLVLTNCCGKNKKVIVKIVQWFTVGAPSVHHALVYHKHDPKKIMPDMPALAEAASDA